MGLLPDRLHLTRVPGCPLNMRKLMKCSLTLGVVSLSLAALVGSAVAADSQKVYDFPIYKNKPSGAQLSGQHAPATTPALTPEEAQKKFVLPEGFEMRLFASEPEIVNPVAMTWDERGRLWVVELYEYPLGAPKGTKPRDRIKILEDTDGDGRADKVTVFADGLNLATGIALGYGGVFVAQAPDFLFLQDTTGSGKADKRTVLKTGLGLDDRHELLNGFTWGPDGQLYMTHGVFTQSLVKDPNDPNDPGIVMTAAVARYHPRTHHFEIYADGTSNPWGVDFDRAGNAFLSACVIDHMFHMAPGGLYARQGGTPAFPYAYQLLPSIVDHRHKMAAYAGVQVYQGNQYPEEYRGEIFIGNIHDNAIHQDHLSPNGSSFKSSFKQDFIRSNDGWFMPVSTQTGPDGALWIMDWYDKYPCYQNARADPDGVDRELGRIWRAVYVGKDKGKPVPSRPEVKMDLGKLSTTELVKTLSHPNIWQRKMAQRLLTERHDPQSREPLLQLLAKGPTLEARLFALWTLHSTEQLNESTLDNLAADPEPAIRTWVARLTGERGNPTEGTLDRLETMARDADPSVRLAVATACRQYVSSSLTVNTPVAWDVEKFNPGKVLSALIEKSADASDTVIPFMIWMAAEPLVEEHPENAYGWLLENGPRTMPLSGQLARKTMRRICDFNQPDKLDSAIKFIGSALEKDQGLTIAALDGLLEGQRGKAVLPTVATTDFFNRLLNSGNPELKDRAQKLGTLWGDANAMQGSINLVGDSKASLDERINAIQVVRKLKNDAARQAMLKIVLNPNPEPLVVEALRGLGEMGSDAMATEVVAHWKELTPGVRRAAADVLSSRGRWASMLLSALESKRVPVNDIPPTAIRTLTRSKDDYGMLAKRAALVFGKVRDADADKLKIIAAKKKMILSGAKAPDINAGHEVAKRTCFICHKLYGEGADVGPDLTGVGRSTLDALLANVIDPNQIVGAGYENVEVETKDGRSVSGRMVENTDVRVRLLSAGPKEEVVAKSDIASMRVSELSVMPEGLEQMPEEDFRNLVAFILNPPGDKQPFNWKDNEPAPAPAAKPSANSTPIDHESVALWNPEWHVDAPDFEGTPVKLPEFSGRKNVLLTHPFSREKATGLERTIDVPAGKQTTLTFAVASHEKGDWELHVLIDGKQVQQQLIDKNGERWKQVTVDLTPYAGRKVKVRLENAANGWSWEFGYWSGIEVKVN